VLIFLDSCLRCFFSSVVQTLKIADALAEYFRIPPRIVRVLKVFVGIALGVHMVCKLKSQPKKAKISNSLSYEGQEFSCMCAQDFCEVFDFEDIVSAHAFFGCASSSHRRKNR
jgi:hypothetical protein